MRESERFGFRARVPPASARVRNHYCNGLGRRGRRVARCPSRSVAGLNATSERQRCRTDWAIRILEDGARVKAELLRLPPGAEDARHRFGHGLALTHSWPIRSRGSSATRHQGGAWSTNPDLPGRRRARVVGSSSSASGWSSNSERSGCVHLDWVAARGAQPGHVSWCRSGWGCGAAGLSVDEQAFSAEWDRNPDGISSSSTTRAPGSTPSTSGGVRPFSPTPVAAA